LATPMKLGQISDRADALRDGSSDRDRLLDLAWECRQLAVRVRDIAVRRQLIITAACFERLVEAREKRVAAETSH